MDGTSPGGQSIDFGLTSPGWGKPTASVFGEPTLPNYAACGRVAPPMRARPAVPLTPFVAPQPQQFQFTPPLSDADVERIARRAAEIVVELLAARGIGSGGA